MNRASVGRVVRVLAVTVLVAAAWRRAATAQEPWWPSVLLALVIVGAVVGGVWWWSRRDDESRGRAVAARAGWQTQAAWADAALGPALTRLGADAGRIRGGTRVTLAWSATEAQLWRGHTVLAELRWDQVWTISRTVGHAASSGNPAVELVTRDLVPLVVVPTRRPDGGMLPATRSQVDDLVQSLREVRNADGRERPPVPE